MTDEFYMKRALALAKRGEGWVSPNPMVGAVIVRGDRIIGEGYHRRFGEEHAEINAIRNATAPVAGATVYITLEPCCHHGKTPPCVESLIACRPARVAIGMADPNPLVCGGSIERLKCEGIKTTVGVLEAECRRLNERFVKFIQRRIPFVTLKFAQTVDGRIATATGHSRWISSPPSLRFAHALRASHDAVLVGCGTVRQDDPELTVRLVRGRQPLRIVLDSRLNTRPEARILKNQDRAKTIIATTVDAGRKKAALYDRLGVEILRCDGDDTRRVDLNKLFIALGKRDISSVLVEGGAAVITTVLREHLADRIVIVVAPKIVGKGVAAVQDLGIATMDDALKLSALRLMRKGGDLVLDGRMQRSDEGVV
jgi:diaminohydroxyphosphoribosylaminopyrimidine deaminase/5-amino-6-(5-phosphoribosylamino)uracil reductase